MGGAVLRLSEWIESTAIGVVVRESTWGFPVLVAIHVMGLACSAGIVVWFDLRLLGKSMTGVPVSRVYRRLMPIAFVGFLVMFVTGLLLLAGFATYAYRNVYFYLKMTALALAGLNAFVYHRVTERSVSAWDHLAVPPRPARLAGLISVALWAFIIMAGRMMAYTLYSR